MTTPAPDPRDVLGRDDPWDPLMPSVRAVHHWTTTNLGEAAPGVLTPLSWALWGAPGERASRWAAYTIGVLTKAELEPPEDPAERILRLFYGRLSMKLEFMAMVGDRVPGTSGREAIRGMFGEAPEGMTFAPTKARYPAIAVRFPAAFAGFPRRLRAVASEQDAWWRRTVAAVPAMDEATARRTFAEGLRRFESAGGVQLLGTLCSVQPLYDATEALIAKAGVGDIAVLSGTGGAELDVVGDIWRASRGALSVEDVVLRYGFHGPGEGEMSSVVWREDDRPLRRLVEQYATRPDSEDPHARDARAVEALARMQGEVVAALPRAQRPVARLVLRLAATRIPMRGIAKRSFLQAIDVSRAAARRAGEHLVARGVLEDRDDVFFLTGEELEGEIPADAAQLVARRRERHAAYASVRLREAAWQGLPEVDVVADDTPAAERSDEALAGIGVSRGVVEGVVRVVLDPAFDDVEPDEILVAPTTDPSWASIMFISAGLVVDIGGALSHAAVVARELQIPCVVGTGDGTRVLRTGDRVRIDGDAGTVEILARADDAATPA